MWLVSIFLLASTSYSQTPKGKETVFSLNIPGGQGNFKDCGVITRNAANLLENISPSCFQGVDNLYFDSDYSLDRRGGYSLYNFTPCAGSKTIKGLWQFNSTGGTKYLIIFSSNSMFSSQQDGSCSVINPDGAGDWNLSSSAEMQCVQSQGFLWCADGVDTPFRTNVTSSQTISGAPIGKHIGAFRNRIIFDSNSNLTQLSVSGELNGLDYSIPATQVSTSPAVISVNGVTDGFPINCMMGEFQNQFLIGRDYDLYALTGYNLQDFTVRKISNQIGCLDPKSVQEVNNQLIWLSRRGVEGYTGATISPISYYIRPTINQIIVAAGNSKSLTINGNTPWSQGQACVSGPNSCLSTTLSVGNVVPSSSTFLDNSTTTFSLGKTFTNIDTGTIIGIQLTSSTFNYPFDGATNIQGPTWTITNGVFQVNANTWSCATNGCSAYASSTVSSGVFTLAGVSAQITGAVDWMFMSQNTGYGVNGYAISSNVNGVIGLFKFVNSISTSLGTCTAPQPSNITVTRDPLGNFTVSTGTSKTACFTASDTTYSTSIYQVISPTTSSEVFGSFYSFSYPLTGTFESRIYDLAFSTPTLGPFSSTFTVTNNNVFYQTAFYVRVSTSPNNDVWDAYAASSDTIKLTNAQKRYAQYKAVLTTFISSTTPQVNAVSLSAESTGYFITPAILVSTPSSFGTMATDYVNNGGSFTFWISTGATAALAGASTATWNQQSPNALISISTATQPTYIAARILFSMDSSTEVPTLNDITFNWNNGTSRPPTTALQYFDRYYLFYTTSTASGSHNDHAVVYDYNQKWTLLDDINAYSSTLYLNQPFIGDSNSTGNIYQMESGQSDNGNPFTYSWQTGDLSFGTPSQRKRFKRLYLFLNSPFSSSQSISLTCNYNIDGDNGIYPLQSYMLTQQYGTGYTVAKFEFPINSPTDGHWLNVQCSNYGQNGPLKVYGMQMIYEPASWE